MKQKFYISLDQHYLFLGTDKKSRNHRVPKLEGFGGHPATELSLYGWMCKDNDMIFWYYPLLLFFVKYKSLLFLMTILPFYKFCQIIIKWC